MIRTVTSVDSLALDTVQVSEGKIDPRELGPDDGYLLDNNPIGDYGVLVQRVAEALFLGVDTQRIAIVAPQYMGEGRKTVPVAKSDVNAYLDGRLVPVGVPANPTDPQNQLPFQDYTPLEADGLNFYVEAIPSGEVTLHSSSGQREEDLEMRNYQVGNKDPTLN